MVALPPVGRGALALARQRLLQRAHDQPAHQAGVAETHLGLSRVHIDIDLARLEGRTAPAAEAVARQIIGIGAAHRADQKLVAHRAAVDEQILPERVGARQRRQSRKAADRTPSRSASIANAFFGSRRPARRRAASIDPPPVPRSPARVLARERESDIRAGSWRGGAPLRARLPPRCDRSSRISAAPAGVKQIAHLDVGALPERGRFDFGFFTGIDGQCPGMRLGFVAGGDDEPRHRSNRRQGLAAKAKRVDGQQIVAGELGGGVALDRQVKFGARMPAPLSLTRIAGGRRPR